MKTIKLTRQRLRTHSSYNSTLTDDEVLKRAKWGAAEDTERDWDGGWSVSSVELLSRFSSPDNSPQFFSQLDKVIVLVTETKTMRYPETTEEST